MAGRIRALSDCDPNGLAILLRLDINSPIDEATHRIVSDNRLRKSEQTLRYLLERGARVAIIAHQGDTLDYHNLIGLEEHAAILTKLLRRPINYIDDVCGPAACAAVSALKLGEAILLGNLRYLTEEVTGFEKEVKLTPSQMTSCWLLRRLGPLFDGYVNDAFAAAHRASPSMVAFQELLPSAAGFQFYQEYQTLRSLLEEPRHPAIFVLGGAKISDAFAMMSRVLDRGVADRILTCGVTGLVFLLAAGYALGERQQKWLADRDLLHFLVPAEALLKRWPERIAIPMDLAYAADRERPKTAEDTVTHAADGERRIAVVCREDVGGRLYLDLGPRTIEAYCREIASAASVFVNGPAGAYEQAAFEEGTARIWQSVARAPGHTVIGGGDTIRAAERFTDLAGFDYVCTGGGAMVRFMTGDRLPLIEAMENASERPWPKAGGRSC